MGRIVTDRHGQTFLNPFQSNNPWVRQMVSRDRSIYGDMMRGYRFMDIASGEEEETFECPKCGRSMFYRPTVGVHACPDCGWHENAWALTNGITLADHEAAGFQGHSCD